MASMNRIPTQVFKTIGCVLLLLALPPLIIKIFLITIGRDPECISIAVVNEEMNENATYCPVHSGCSFRNLSCSFINILSKNPIQKKFYKTPSEAKHAVVQGYHVGAIYFTDNFTDALVARTVLGREADDETLDQSEIRVWIDMTNEILGLTLKRYLFEAYQNFAQQMLVSCRYNPKLASIPFQIHNPIYGLKNPTLTDFAAPGVTILISFLMAFISGLCFHNEANKTSITNPPSWKIDCGDIELIFVALKLMIVFAQSVIIVVCMFSILGVQYNGHFLTIFTLILIQGVCGWTLGNLCKVLSNEYQSLPVFALSVLFAVSLFLSGIFWPIESVPRLLQLISICFPLTVPTQALKIVLNRKTPFDFPQVLVGLVVPAAWTLLFCLAYITYKRSNKRHLYETPKGNIEMGCRASVPQEFSV